MDRRAYSQENRNQRADSVAKTVVISPKAEAETPNPTGIKGLFEGLSVSQVTAGALAAVTSMLLSAQIGIAGSVIGVAVGSVVSTVSSQLYKKFLAGSAEKLRGFASSDNEEENAATNAVAAQSATQSFAHAQTTVMPITRAPFESAETTTLPSVGTATRAFNEAAYPQAKSLGPMHTTCAAAKPLKAPNRIRRASIAQPAIRAMRATQQASSRLRPKNKRPCSAACSRFQSPRPLRQSCCSRASCLCLPVAKASVQK